MRRADRRRDERGLVAGTRLLILSVLAIGAASVAFFFTSDQPTEREVAIPARATTTAGATPSAEPTTEAVEIKKKQKPKQKPVNREETYVAVFNNSGITGLAGSAASKANELGWQVVGSDNWYGTIPANTVYYPERLKREGEQLALDLGIERTMPSVEPMQFDRLTVILTGPLD